MANPEQLEHLQDSAGDWNLYRREHAITHPDLSGADLTGANLTEVNATNAPLLSDRRSFAVRLSESTRRPDFLRATLITMAGNTTEAAQSP